jgi:hypothetical protein
MPGRPLVTFTEGLNYEFPLTHRVHASSEAYICHIQSFPPVFLLR